MKKQVMVFLVILVVFSYGCVQQPSQNEKIIPPQQKEQIEQQQPREIGNMPPECIGKTATSSNLPEPCKIWFSMQNSQEHPSERRENEESALGKEGKASEVPERVEVDCQKSKMVFEDLPASNFPKPFEHGYFTGMMSEEVIATFGDLEITADKNPLVFHYPMDPFVARTVIIKNKGTKEAVIEYISQNTIHNFL